MNDTERSGAAALGRAAEAAQVDARLYADAAQLVERGREVLAGAVPYAWVAPAATAYRARVEELNEAARAARDHCQTAAAAAGAHAGLLGN
ncbi:MAG: hypothetical protein LBM66_02255 [Bifidobacteriaceae bacterium]|jgi:hypothetical protein|nr:hypothetical protein [Bifidobacteriaceae bacterium]